MVRKRFGRFRREGGSGVLVRVFAALDAALGLGIAVQAALHELGLVDDLVQFGV